VLNGDLTICGNSFAFESQVNVHPDIVNFQIKLWDRGKGKEDRKLGRAGKFKRGGVNQGQGDTNSAEIPCHFACSNYVIVFLYIPSQKLFSCDKKVRCL